MRNEFSQAGNFFCCYTYWIHASLIYAEIWPAVYKQQPFCKSSLESRRQRECEITTTRKQCFICLFQFSELKCFPHSPTPCIPSSISLHLVGPTCLSLICLPCTISHFFPPSVNHTCILHTPSPIYCSCSFLFLSLSFTSILLSVYTFITRSVLFLLHHILMSLASTFPFFSSGKSNSTPQLPLSSLQYCGKNLQI